MSAPSYTFEAPRGAEPVSTAWVVPVLDQIDYGLILIDPRGTNHCNRAARSELALPGYPLRLVGGRIRASDAQEDALLESALVDALEGARRRLLTLHGSGRPLPVAVVPLSGSATEPGAAAVLLVLGKRQLCSRLTEQWFCLSHGLTPAESVVLGDILAGHDPSTIAQRTGVAISTVRTHLARIRDKTATGGIRELVLAAAALPPMVSATHAFNA